MIKELRKIVTFDEDIYKEGGKEANPTLRVIGVAAVLENPWKGEKFIDDLQPRRIRSQLYAKDGKFVDRSELVTGPGGERGDKIPAMLSDGEFVVNAAAVRGIGLQAEATSQPTLWCCVGWLGGSLTA